MADRHGQHSGDAASKRDHSILGSMDRGVGISAEIDPPMTAEPSDGLKSTDCFAGYRFNQPRAQVSRGEKRPNQDQREYATDGVAFPATTALSIYRSKEQN